MSRRQDGGEKIREQRDRNVDKIENGKMAVLPMRSPATYPVVGVTFTEFYPQNLHDLMAINLEAEAMGERVAVVIVREPDNPVDPNSCAVHVPALGKRGHIGHLVRPVALRLAPELDTGVRWRGEVASIRVSPSNPDKPGIDINLERIA